MCGVISFYQTFIDSIPSLILLAGCAFVIWNNDLFFIRN